MRRRFVAGRSAALVRRTRHRIRGQAVRRPGRAGAGGAHHDRRGHARRHRHRGHAGACGGRRRPGANSARSKRRPARATGRRGHRGGRGRGPARAPPHAGRDGSARVARDRRGRCLPPAAGRILLDRRRDPAPRRSLRAGARLRQQPLHHARHARPPRGGHRRLRNRARSPRRGARCVPRSIRPGRRRAVLRRRVDRRGPTT